MAMPDDVDHTGRNFWQAAWDELPAKTRDILEASTISENETPTSRHVEAIINIAEQKKKEYEGRQSTVRLGIYEIVSWVQKFKEIGDVLVSVDPVHAAPPWAAFRFILQTIIAGHEKMETTMSILEFVSCLFHRGRVLEEVYHRAVVDSPVGQQALDNLQAGLVKLYVQILKSLGYCQSELKKNTVHRSASAFVKPDAANNILKELGNCYRSAEEHARDNDRLKLSEILRQLQRHLPDTMKDVSAMLVKLEENQQIEILEQISTVTFRGHHKFVHDQRTANTGEWLLNTREFQQWQAARSSTITILYGSPGAGKTFLTSRVIDHILEKLDCSGLGTGFGYFYCDRNDEKRRQPQSILRSLVRQFASPAGSQDAVHKDIQKLCKKVRTDCLEMDVEMCKGILATLITSYKSPIIVLDALDECDGARSQLMDCLTWLMRESMNLKIFISSRKDHDIQKHFRSSPHIIIKATDNERDIEAFVKEKLANDVDWKTRSPELQKETIDTLFSRSKGMFQWAALQVQQILEIKHCDEVAVRECLKALPATLEEAYQRIWEKIDRQQPHDRKLAKRAIRWVLCARFPLSTPQLGTAIRIDDKGENLYDITEKPSEEAISGVCCNLLIFDKEQRHWRFCHLSAAEYVEKKLEADYLLDHYAAICCIKYLSSGEFFNGEFGEYASDEWHCHLKARGTENLRLKHLVNQFLGHARSSSNAYQEWTKHIYRDRWNALRDRATKMRPTGSPLFGIAVLGLTQVLKDWCESGDVTHLDLNKCNEKGCSLLGLAAQYGHFDLCIFLIKQHVDINKGINPLHLACQPPIFHMWKISQMVKLLLDAGVDPNARYKGHTVLQTAFYNGLGGEVIQILADRGVRLGDTQATLIEAATAGYLEWIEHCLQSGAEVNRHDESGDVALVSAARYGKLKAVQLLLRLGADVNLSRNDLDYSGCIMDWNNGWNNKGWTALSAAAWRCEYDVIKLLLETGADPNPRMRWSPIWRVVQGRGQLAEKIKTIELLLDFGAEINSPHSVSPLVGAMQHHDEEEMSCQEMIQFLKFFLGAGADPNHVPRSMVRDDFHDPLSTALYWDHVSAVSLLLQAGADTNKKDGLKNTLCLMARDNHSYYLQMLLDLGADPTLTFTEGPGSALASAAFYGNLKGCHFFLQPELGVDVNTPLHGWFDNALIAAISPTHGKSDKNVSVILNMMFQAGADIPMPYYLTLGPALPATKLQHQDEYFFTGIRTFSKTGNVILLASFSKDWIHILWDFYFNPMSYPPLRLLLGRCSPLHPLPPSANVIIKLTSASSPYTVRYAGLFVSRTRVCHYLFNDEKKVFEPLSKLFPTTATIQPPTMEPFNAENLQDTFSGPALSRVLSKLSCAHIILLTLVVSLVCCCILLSCSSRYHL